MQAEVDSLEPLIREILAAPFTDLATISAKRVRRQLVEMNPSISEDFVKTHKAEVDLLIAKVFESVSNAAGAGTDGDDAESAGAVKRKREDDGGDEGGSHGGDQDFEDEGYDDEEETKPRAKSKSSKGRPKKDEITDEELARQLSSELNGRSSRVSRSGKTNGRPKKGASRSPKKPKKSAERVADSDEDSNADLDDGKKPKKKRKSANGGGGAKGGFGKEFNLSDPLAALLSTNRLSRPQVVKGLWDYIKENDLQNPKDRREILCDASLRAVFNVDKISMFKMNKVLGQHLHDEE
ncbi:SWIB-domain-containing protein [Rickenella mellea]|uniref:SWIB-domain-containing protein n=1 Tax=Rickenella mellea TaxID=50990 RepID=A0A4Y7Q5Y2_9AGAM|nr:SWIB-domain-containing protein [Rickenella mellea]